jgi:hypothetical protein
MRNKSGRLKKENSLLALTIRKIKENSKIWSNSTKNTTNRIHSKDNSKSYSLTTDEPKKNNISKNKF